MEKMARWVDPPIGLSSNGSSCRAECRSRLCARHGPTRYLHRATVGFIGSGAGCGRSRSNPSREFDAQSGASAAKSEHWHAPLIRLRPLTSPFSCARRHKRATNRGVPLPSPLVASAWRCIEALPNGQPFAPYTAQSYVLECGRVQAARRSTGTQAARTRCSQARCEGAGRTCKMQLARCSAAVPG